MKNTVKLAIYGLTLGSVLIACGQDESEHSTSALSSISSPAEKLQCATPASGPFAFLSPWKVRSRDEPRMVDDKPTEYGVEITEDVRKSLDPLSGTGIVTRRTCSRAYQIIDDNKVWLEADRMPGNLTVTDTKIAKQYLILSGQIGEKYPHLQIAILDLATGLRKTIAGVSAPIGACNEYVSAHPSPSGDTIAQMTLKTVCGNEPAPYTVTVDLFDSAGKDLGNQGVYTFGPAVFLNWTSDTEFTLKDDVTSVSIDVTN